MLLYLIELRQRLRRCLFFFILFFAICFYFSTDLLRLLLSPLTQALKPPHALIAMQVASPLWALVDVATEVALLLTMPIVLFELWRFLVPALYRKERVAWRSLIGISVGLFLIGVMGCFFVVLPLICQFLVGYAPASIQLMPDVTVSLHFILNFLWTFGIGFQLPLVCVGLVGMNWMSERQLLQARRYVIVGAFIFGMFLAPPDVLSQTVLALPLWGVYEIGVLLVRFMHLWRWPPFVSPEVKSVGISLEE